MRHWIFDLDGTLVNSFPCYNRVLDDVLTDYGVVMTDADRAVVRSLVAPKFLARVLPPEHIEAAFERIIKLTIERQGEVTIFSGVVELLVFLREQGCTLSVFTARERITALGLLEVTGLRPYFSHVVTRSCVANCKPFPDGIHHILNESKTSPDIAVMIGDHKMDMQSAKSAGIKSISVSWDGHASDAHEISDHHFVDITKLQSWATAQFVMNTNSVP